MTLLADRMAEIQALADEGAGYYQRLIRNMGGLESAARADLAIDGDYWQVDLRRTPYAGDEHLKALAREAIRAQTALRNALIEIAWRDADAP